MQILINLTNTGQWHSYREQTDRVAKIKEETTRAIVKNSNDIVMFKAQVSQHLRELQEFAEQE